MLAQKKNKKSNRATVSISFLEQNNHPISFGVADSFKTLFYWPSHPKISWQEKSLKLKLPP
jgi:hypothetical protein